MLTALVYTLFALRLNKHLSQQMISIFVWLCCQYVYASQHCLFFLNLVGISLLFVEPGAMNVIRFHFEPVRLSINSGAKSECLLLLSTYHLCFVLQTVESNNYFNAEIGKNQEWYNNIRILYTLQPNCIYIRLWIGSSSIKYCAI